VRSFTVSDISDTDNTVSSKMPLQLIYQSVVRSFILTFLCRLIGVVFSNGTMLSESVTELINERTHTYQQ